MATAKSVQIRTAKALEEILDSLARLEGKIDKVMETQAAPGPAESSTPQPKGK